MVSTYFSRYIILLLFIYLFNGFHHDHNAKIRQGRRNAFEEVTRMRDKGQRCGTHDRVTLQIKCALKKNTQLLCNTKKIIRSIKILITPI